MKCTDIEQWDTDTMTMIEDPQRGDEFTEHFGSQMMVVRRFPGWVAVRRPDRPHNKWGRVELMSLAAFRKHLVYDTMPDRPVVEGWRKGSIPRHCYPTVASESK